MTYLDLGTVRTRRDGGAVWASLDNGELNMMDQSMHDDLSELAAALEGDESVSVLVVDSANPDYFCAHADISGSIPKLPELPPPATELTQYQALFERFRALPQATVCVIAGRARGAGVEMATALDMRFADRDRAVFGQPEVALGAMPGYGSTQYLPMLLGRGRALELLLASDDIDAPTAAAYGLVNRALPGEELDEYVAALVARIATFPRAATRAAKASVDAHVGDLKPGMLAETDNLMTTMLTDEVPRRIDNFIRSGGQTRALEDDLGKNLLKMVAGEGS